VGAVGAIGVDMIVAIGYGSGDGERVVRMMEGGEGGFKRLLLVGSLFDRHCVGRGGGG